jgi:hypothetical protein
MKPAPDKDNIKFEKAGFYSIRFDVSLCDAPLHAVMRAKAYGGQSALSRILKDTPTLAR